MDDLILAIEDAEDAHDEVDEIKDAILRLVENTAVIGVLLKALEEKVAVREELWQIAEQNPEFAKRYRDRRDAHGQFLMAAVRQEMKEDDESEDFDDKMSQK